MVHSTPIPHPPDWPVVNLGDIAVKIGSGATPRGGSDTYLESRLKYALIRSQNVFDRWFDRSGLAFISDEQASALKQVSVRPGDLLLNITGDGITFSRCCVTPEDVLPACVNQHVSIVRVNPKLAEPGYVLGFLTHPVVKSYIESFNAGGSRRAITKGHIESFCLPLPPLEEQKNIARVLDTLDDKVELNRRMNETLEAMARAIFKSWFVDFDPVRAKAGGRQPFGMDAATAALFPNSFQDSPIGKIPKGWKASPLPEVVEINPSYLLAKGKETAYLDMANVPTRGHRPNGWITREFVSGSRFMNGDTLLARITPCLENGKSAFVDFLKVGEVGWGSTEFIVLRPRDPLPPEYGYCLARYENFRDFAIQNMTGSSGRQRVPTNCFDQYWVSVPTEIIAQKFGRIVRLLFAKVKANSEESATLATIRDVLLPKLISGEIRVKDFEEVL